MTKRLVEVGLFTLVCADGKDPSAEHDDVIAHFEREGLSLDELNALLFRCARPARAEPVSADDPDYDEDVELLHAAKDKTR